VSLAGNEDQPEASPILELQQGPIGHFYKFACLATTFCYFGVWSEEMTVLSFSLISSSECNDDIQDGCDLF
jgi:hypothetical protein